MVKSIFHILEALFEFTLHVDVEHKTTSESGHDNRGTDRFHFKVEQLVDKNPC